MRSFTPQEILNRAADYGIGVSLEGDNLALDIPPTLDYGIKAKAIGMLKEHKAGIIACLRAQIDALLAEAGQMEILCCVCLDEDRETPAIADYEGIMYCSEHMPAAGHPVVQEARRLFGATMIVEPRTTLREHIANTHREMKASALQADGKDRGRIWSYLVLCAERGWDPDERIIHEMKQGTDQGYAEEFEASEQALLNRCDTPRSYPGPVPRYELQEDANGVKHLVIVGFWPEQSQEVSA